MSLFEVLSFSEDNFTQALKNDFFTPEEIKSENHFEYLLEYLGDNSDDSLDSKTIVIEKDYISRSHLNDYSEYYSKCFNDKYNRKCKRLHFFNVKFNYDEALEDVVLGKEELISDSNYLGYIVVKNLPSAIIGATLLKTYRNGNSRFFITRECQAYLFGKELKFKSLIFQEQDKVVSACATTALWICFHKTSELFQTTLPTPNEITNSAKNTYNYSGRTFPNVKGLDHTQIGNAIENVGLVFELRNQKGPINDPNYLRGFIYSYLKAGLPVLIGISIENVGLHLITISGFKNNIKEDKKRDNVTISLLSDDIQQFYAHDDRIGPYSRFYINDRGIFCRDNSKKEAKIVKTSWPKKIWGDPKLKATVASIIVPLYKKIRICFDDVLNEVRPFDYLFKNALGSSYSIKWNIFLSSSNDYKKEVLSNRDLSNEFKKEIITIQLPKFLWIARLVIDETDLLELLFDSTDVASGHFCLKVNCFDQSILELIESEIKQGNSSNNISVMLNQHFLNLLKSLGNKVPTTSM